MVVTSSVVEHVGRQEVTVNEPVAPDGKPETEKTTDAAVPEVSAEVTTFEAELPAVTETVPLFEFESEKLKDGGVVAEPTFRVNDVVCVIEPLVPVTVIGKLPADMEVTVDIFNVVEHVGLHEDAVNELVTPDGRPETEKVTGAAVPELSVEVMVLEVEFPALTESDPLFEREKANAVTVVPVY